jgi:hypothetical protein
MAAAMSELTKTGARGISWVAQSCAESKSAPTANTVRSAPWHSCSIIEYVMHSVQHHSSVEPRDIAHVDGTTLIAEIEP